jgi:hypothetical protein
LRTLPAPDRAATEPVRDDGAAAHHRVPVRVFGRRRAKTGGQAMTTPQASQTQVGGDHYRRMSIQPVKFIHSNHIPFLEANVIKYVCRHRAKGGRADIEKAIHYLQLILELDYPETSSSKETT